MEVSSEGDQPEKKSNGWWILFWLVTFLGIGGIVWHIILLMSGPVTGGMEKTDIKYSLDEPNLSPPLNHFYGAYFSIYLPGTYSEKRHVVSTDKANPTLEQVFFTQLVDPGRKAALTIEQGTDRKKEDLSSFVFRMQHPETYVKDSYEWNGKRMVLFLKNDPVYEILGYVEKNGLVASLVVSSAIETPEKLMSDFTDILKSFTWGDSGAST